MKKCTIITLFFTLLFFVSCGGKKTNTINENVDPNQAKEFLANWSKENVVVNHWLNEPPTLHPTNENNANKTFVFNYIHSYLYNIDLESLNLKPDLAKELPKVSSDGLVYSIDLKDEAKWDDGSPITTDDVIFTFKANKSQYVLNAFAKPYLEFISDIIKKTDKSFDLKLKSKYILNDYILADFVILQEKIYDKNLVLRNYTMIELSEEEVKSTDLSEWADEFNSAKFGSEPTNLIGSGPYKVESWQTGQTITLVKKTNHWASNITNKSSNHEALPDKIIFRVGTDENTTKIEFKNQTYDVSTFISTKGLLDLEKDNDFKTNYNYDFVTSFNSTYLIMNTKPSKRSKLFDDKLVRRAMAHLTPIDDVIKVVYDNKAERMVSPVHNKKADFNTSLKAIDFNIDMANQLLDQAGWKDTDKDNVRDKIIDGKKVKFVFELLYPSNSPVAKDIAELVADNMNKAQIKAKPNGVTLDKCVTQATTHDFDMVFFGFGVTSTPDDFSQLWSTNSWVTNGSNFSGFGNDQSDALIDSIRTELDPVKRKNMSWRFQKLVYDEQPVIFFLTTTRKIIIHKRFGNANMYSERPGVMLNRLKLLYGVIPNVTLP